MPETETQNPAREDIYGQYASDWALRPDADFTDQTGTLDARGDGNAAFHHGAILFDHVDRVPDEATGVSSAETQKSEFEELAMHIGELPVANTVKIDSAELWLRQHDPGYNQKEWH